ncbi:MAG: 2-oxoglutarate dehydrogenase, E2 component, dihydrolipoamide succinyltransferase, partial [Planctomycetota bacterium]|nr:2-oxoglutarate dehydrogenase, E2 component, dihydrolipoamide succinyltransferase [Planctomycetota bacterium]
MRSLLIVIGLAILGAGAFTLTLKRGAIAAPTDTARESVHAVDAPANAAPAPAEVREIAAAASAAPAIPAASPEPQPEPAPEARAPRGPAPAA